MPESNFPTSFTPGSVGYGSGCTICPAGQTSSSGYYRSSSTSCTICPAGRYLSDPATSHTLHDSQDDCATDCPANFIVDSDRSTCSSTTTCGPGEGPSEGAAGETSVCQTCPLGRFSSTTSNTRCEGVCPSGKSTTTAIPPIDAASCKSARL